MCKWRLTKDRFNKTVCVWSLDDRWLMDGEVNDSCIWRNRPPTWKKWLYLAQRTQHKSADDFFLNVTSVLNSNCISKQLTADGFCSKNKLTSATVGSSSAVVLAVFDLVFGRLTNFVSVRPNCNGGRCVRLKQLLKSPSFKQSSIIVRPLVDRFYACRLTADM